jgi:hypothetical protein
LDIGHWTLGIEIQNIQYPMNNSQYPNVERAGVQEPFLNHCSLGIGHWTLGIEIQNIQYPMNNSQYPNVERLVYESFS